MNLEVESTEELMDCLPSQNGAFSLAYRAAREELQALSQTKITCIFTPVDLTCSFLC